MAHWADEVADRITAASKTHTLATGISPSGEIHLGNLREVMTAAGVAQVLEERRVAARLLFIADNLDPLRRVYPFLDPAVYTPLVGQSLSHIRCPCGAHASYSEHFLEPFLASLTELGVAVEVVRAEALYASGRMDGVIGQALAGAGAIAKILNELTGKEVAADWSPFDPRCLACGSLTTTEVTGYDLAARTVGFRCACGATGEVPFAGGGKLTWRVDWPARWQVLGVTLEPFGKDHASRGGSYDTGVRIIREVFGSEPPFPVPYEWIALKGRGDMSSSKGNVLAIHRMLKVAPPEVLRYLVLRAEPARSIQFDPGLPLLNLCDELENAEHKNRNARAAELARLPGSGSGGVPFRHLVTVAQVAGFDTGRAREVLARTGYQVNDAAHLERSLGYVRNWLAEFAPEEVRFAVADELPAPARDLAPEQRAFLGDLAARLPEGADGESLHILIYDAIQARGAPSPAPFFAALYRAFIGKDRGPRAGHFLAALPTPFVRRRLQEAAAGPGPAAG
jgi:lysyl-tRNA synthetase class 1